MIKDIILSACAAFVLVNVLEWQYLMRINRKPLNCAVCLSGWIFLLLHFLPDQYDIPFYMCAAMVSLIIIEKAIK